MIHYIHIYAFSIKKDFYWLIILVILIKYTKIYFSIGLFMKIKNNYNITNQF